MLSVEALFVENKDYTKTKTYTVHPGKSDTV